MKLVVAILLVSLWSSVCASDSGQVRISVTNTFYTTGVLQKVLMDFAEREPDIEVQLISVGSLQALDDAREAAADLVISHHPRAENILIENGLVSAKVQLAYTHFAVFGPVDDELGLSRMDSVRTVLHTMADEEVEFVAPSPRGGTFAKIVALWAMAGINPDWPGYEDTSISSQAALLQANQFSSYTIAETGAYYKDKSAFSDRIAPLYEDDLALRNIYSLLLVHQRDELNQEAVVLFDYLISASGQNALLEAAHSIFNADILIPAAAHDMELGLLREQEELKRQTRTLQSGLLIAALLVLMLGLSFIYNMKLNRSERLRQRMQLDAELQKHALERAEYESEMKSHFLASITHDLKTPIHAITGFATLTMDTLDTAKPEKLELYTRNILNSSDRLLHLVNDLLDMARLEQGKCRYNFTAVSIEKLIDASLEELSPLISKKRLTVDYDNAQDAHILQVDAQRITQVLINVLANAIRFSPEGGVLELSCVDVEMNESGSEHISGVCLFLRDAGPGIPESELEKVFEKFVQSSYNSGEDEGTGLGLAICDEIVSSHGGTITISNHKDGGAVVQIELPAQQSD